MKSKLFYLFIISTFVLIDGLAQDKKAIRFVDEYLNSAFWKVQGKDRPLVKWENETDTIKYKLVGKIKYLREKSWNKYLSEIEFLTGITISKTEESDYDILIFFGELEEYATISGARIPLDLGSKFNNWSSRNWDRNYNLTQTSYCIVPSKIGNSREGEYRLKKGILKSFGILGELEDKNSIFNKFPTRYNTDLSREDKRFIKLHYSESVKAGTNKETLRRILLDLPKIEELSKEKL